MEGRSWTGMTLRRKDTRIDLFNSFSLTSAREEARELLFIQSHSAANLSMEPEPGGPI